MNKRENHCAKALRTAHVQLMELLLIFVTQRENSFDNYKFTSYTYYLTALNLEISPAH